LGFVVEVNKALALRKLVAWQKVLLTVNWPALGKLVVSIILAPQHDDAAVQAHEEHERID